MDAPTNKIAQIARISQPDKVSAKAFIITLILIPLNYYWLIQLEAIRYTFPTLVAPMYSVIVNLLILLILNALIQKLFPKISLNGGDLSSIYVLLSIASLFCSYDIFLPLVSVMAHAFWFATPENEWQSLFWRHLPSWLTVSDKKALEGFYNGESSFYWSSNLKAWLLPLFLWSVFTFALFFTSLCINSILRKQWTEREKLSYPIIQLPFEITNHASNFFKRKLMWFGFALAGGICLINGLNFLQPSVPYIPVKLQPIGQYFTEKPWSAINAGTTGYVYISFYPFAIGLCFLMPLDLLFSCWLFYFFYKFESVFGSIIGIDRLTGFPFAHPQGFGAFTGVCAIALWSGRGHFLEVLRSAFSRRNRKKFYDDSGDSGDSEPMRYRASLWGAAIGLALIITFCAKAGTAIWVTILFFMCHFIIAATFTRMRAEQGMFVHSSEFMGPHHILTTLFGTRRLGTENLTGFSLLYWFNRNSRSHPMPHQLEAFKLAERSQISYKSMSNAMILISAISIPICLCMILQVFYKLGVDSGKVGGQILSFGSRSFNLLQNWLHYPVEADWIATGFMAGGFSFTLLLATIRRWLFWFPLHPLGYALAFNFDLRVLWSCFLVASLIKWSILKYGGISLYRRSIYFFMGLTLGDFVLGSFWSLVGMILNIKTYDFWM